ncbi:MAG: leucine-rich repeat domain-containing protein [Bacteroidales bacterium]
MDRDEVLEAIELAKEQKLKKLSLSNRGITELPPEIGRLSFVQKLDLSYNNIQELPEEFCHLTNLRSLYLNHNEIRELPDRFGNMVNLSVLDLSHNRIQALPDTLGDINNLTHLDLSFNKLARLPLSLVNLTGLKKLYLESNPSEFPPEKVIKRGLYATMHFLFGEIRKKESAKVIMQVYNMPRELITPFSEYINCFNDLVSSANDQQIQFDVKYIKQDFTANMEMDFEMERYLLEFMNYLKEQVGSRNFKSFKEQSKHFFDLQIVELRDQLKLVNQSLDAKMEDLKQLQDRINYLGNVLNKNQEE